MRGGVTPLGRGDRFISPKAVLRKGSKGVRLYEGGLVAFVGVDAVKTNKRECVCGTKQGDVTIFALDADETQIYYL